MDDEDICIIDEVKKAEASKTKKVSKTCFICEKSKAEYAIKGTEDFYCKDCAEDAFGDLDLLEKL